MVVVFDASSVVGAALKETGVPRRALLSARQRNTIALSWPVYSEIDEVLRRPKFAAVLTEGRRLDVMELLLATAAWFQPVVMVQDCRDAKDNKYLELALSANAEIIVSSDADLLDLDPWRGIRIMRPVEFLTASGPPH